MKCTEVVH